MALDRSVLGNLAAEQMEALERVYGDEEDVHIGAVINIVEVLKSQGNDEHGNPQYGSYVRMRHNVADPYRAIGLMQQAVHNVLGSSGAESQDD
jgi:hypothetical protein